MLADKPVIDSENVPVPVPELVLVLNEMVGLILVFHTIPFELILAPPSVLIDVVIDAGSTAIASSCLNHLNAPYFHSSSF